MDLQKLDLSALEKALASLNEAVTEFAKQPTNNFIRDAAIQRFEYSYELSHKMLKRFLELTESSAIEVDQMSFADLIRTGSERGLLSEGWDVWKDYRHARNITSHTYNEKKATEVYALVPKFLSSSQNLLNRLQSRIAQGEH